MIDHERGVLCFVVCAPVCAFCVSWSVTVIVGGKTPPRETCRTCKTIHTRLILHCKTTRGVLTLNEYNLSK